MVRSLQETVYNLVRNSIATHADDAVILLEFFGTHVSDNVMSMIPPFGEYFCAFDVESSELLDTD